ncbi:MAG: hypothetical protein V4596_13620 [Bdellovibrionota bacterium]
MFKNIILSFMAVLFLSSTASATIIFNPSIFYYTRDEKQGSTTSTEFNQQIINLKLGYTSGQGLYLGVAYDMESREYGSGATDQDRDSLGATIGYVSGGWQLLGTYYFQSELEDYEGTGYVIDIGYIFNVGSIGIGPLLSYRHWEYDEQNGASVTSLEHNNVLPSVQFQFTF